MADPATPGAAGRKQRDDHAVCGGVPEGPIVRAELSVGPIGGADGGVPDVNADRAVPACHPPDIPSLVPLQLFPTCPQQSFALLVRKVAVLTRGRFSSTCKFVSFLRHRSSRR